MGRRAAVRMSWGLSRWRVRSWLEEKKREWGIGNGEWKIGRAENARAAGEGGQRMGSRSLIGRSAPSFPIPYSPFPLLPHHISCLATSSPPPLYCFPPPPSGARAPPSAATTLRTTTHPPHPPAP